MAGIQLDLTKGGVLAPALLQRLDRLADTGIASFNRLIAGLGRGHERDIDWWVSRPASRNVFVSPLFDRCMQLLLIRELLAEGETVDVLTDDTAMAATLLSVMTGNLTVQLRRGLSTRLRPLVSTAHNIVSTLFHTLAAARAASATRSAAKRFDETPLTVLDVFVLRDSVSGGNFHDRYFPGLRDDLTPQQRRNLCYMPTFYRIRDYRTLFGVLRNLEMNFLFQQDYLTLGDYLFAFGHWFRLRRLRGLSGQFAGMRIDPIIRADLSAGRFAQSVIPALLSYRFWSRQRAKDVRIARIINWYEGQDIDHALAAAIAWNGLDVELIGFRPACSRFELSITPAPHEVAAEVVPRVMAITGEGFRREIAEANPGIRTQTAPGLRYRRLASLSRKPPDAVSTILIVLPLSASAIEGVRDLITPDSAAGLRNNEGWLLKRHPAMPRAEAEKLFGALPAGFKFVEGDFYDWLPCADIVVGLESSALLEAIAIGVPAICLARGNIPTKNPFPSWADPRLWRVCYDHQDIRKATGEMVSLNETEVDLASLRQNLLSPADPATTRKLLGLD